MFSAAPSKFAAALTFESERNSFVGRRLGKILDAIFHNVYSRIVTSITVKYYLDRLPRSYQY